jgi:hypothetical protein
MSNALVRLLSACGLAACLYLPSGQGHAETVLCDAITSVPIVISTPGNYCLARDLTMSADAAAAIVVAANHVSLDCNDRSITRYSSSSASYGVLASERAWVKVRGCSLHLFPTGIALVRMKQGEVSGNTITTSGQGILATGDGIDIDGNVVTALYGSTGPNIGISAETGYSGQPVAAMRVTGNRLSAIRGYGIGVLGGRGVLVEGNYIQMQEQTDPKVGIWVVESGDLPATPMLGLALVRGNDLFGNGSYTGLYVVPALAEALCVGNTIHNAAVGNDGCTTGSPANTEW